MNYIKRRVKSIPINILDIENWNKEMCNSSRKPFRSVGLPIPMKNIIIFNFRIQDLSFSIERNRKQKELLDQ